MSDVFKCTNTSGNEFCDYTITNKPRQCNYEARSGGSYLDCQYCKKENNRMNNLAICLRSDEEFKEGFIYECTQPYNGMIDVCSPKGSFVTMDADDKNFTFILNPNETIEQILKNNHTVFDYQGNIVK